MQRAEHPPRPSLLARLRRHWLILLLAATCILVELALVGAERGVWGSTRWRVLAYLNGGFWAGLVRAGWEGNFALQPITMFFSHPLLHAGFAHLATNVIALLALGAAVRMRAGQTGLAVVLLAACLGGGAAFAAVGPLGQPMVGVSAGLFGLAAALMVWQARASRKAGRRMWDMVGLATGLMLANLASAWAMNWQLAWEAHVGGFVAGGLAAMAISLGWDRRRA